MIKLVCYGVRETEVKYFEEINKKFGYDIKLVTLGLNHENVKEAIGAEAVMVRGNCKADRQNLELLKANGLKYLLTRTVGFDHVDLEAVKDLDLKCARVPGYSPNAISELAVSLAMMLLRHTAYTVNRTREKNFVVDSFMFSKEVRNCTVAVLGAGKIGLTTAKLFKGLGARVIAYDVFQSDAAKEVVEFMELDEVLAQADIISVHMPYIKDVNYHMINDEFISKCQQGICPIYAAFDKGKMIGIIGMYSNRKHINLAFTKKEYHRQGVATSIFQYLLADILKDAPKLHEITLNSSPYGKPFYLHIGFKPQSDEQEIDGIRFTPMKYTI